MLINISMLINIRMHTSSDGCITPRGLRYPFWCLSWVLAFLPFVFYPQMFLRVTQMLWSCSLGADKDMTPSSGPSQLFFKDSNLSVCKHLNLIKILYFGKEIIWVNLEKVGSDLMSDKDGNKIHMVF